MWVLSGDSFKPFEFVLFLLVRRIFLLVRVIFGRVPQPGIFRVLLSVLGVSSRPLIGYT